MTELPNGWSIKTIDQLQTPERRSITDGPFGSNLTSAHYTASGPRVVRLQNIGDGVFVNAKAHISQAHFDSLKNHEVKSGDLLIASLGDALPRACLAPETLGPAIVKADCIRVRLASDVDPRFVLYSLQRPAVKHWAIDQLHGVGRMRLGLKGIRQIPVPLPELPEQRRIVEVLEDHLSRLDAAKGYVSTSGRQLVALKKSVLMSIVPSVTSYPIDWAQETVVTAGSVTLGRQRHPDWHTGDNMHPYLRVANVFEDRIDESDVKHMHWPEGSFERFRLEPGDVLLNEGQSPEFLGRPAIYRGRPESVAFTNTLLRFKASDRVLPEFALLVFRRHMHAGRFARESRITTNIGHLSAARLKSVEFPIPPLDEQRALVRQADTAFESIKAIERAVSVVELRHAALRRSLLSAAFSGRLTGKSSDLGLAEELAAT